MLGGTVSIVHNFQSQLFGIFFSLEKRFGLRVWNLVITDLGATLMRFNHPNLVLV